jgi:hypothetical protein
MVSVGLLLLNLLNRNIYIINVLLNRNNLTLHEMEYKVQFMACIGALARN